MQLTSIAWPSIMLGETNIYKSVRYTYERSGLETLGWHHLTNH